MKSGSQRGICICMFIAALFTIAKIRKQPKCPLIDEWIKKNVVYTYNETLLSLKKGNPAICPNMDEPGRHYAK